MELTYSNCSAPQTVLLTVQYMYYTRTCLTYYLFCITYYYTSSDRQTRVSDSTDNVRLEMSSGLNQRVVQA